MNLHLRKRINKKLHMHRPHFYMKKPHTVPDPKSVNENMDPTFVRRGEGD